MTDVRLARAASTVLDATGAGTAAIGPTAAGPGYWHVVEVILTTSRPGASPVPRAQIYLDSLSPAALEGISYDGSYDAAACDLWICRGQLLIAVWQGGALNDLASITVHGTMSAEPR